MNWVSLILQLLALRKGLDESRSMVDTAREYAERGKRTLVSFLLGLLASLFFFTALVTAVIELGLQIDAGLGVHYTGLMVSASIFFLIGVLLVAVAWLLAHMAPSAPPPPPNRGNPRAEHIKDALEEFLVRFLSQLGKPKSQD